jgi:RimJ/RimL family protein N-acetyltransferase
MFKEIGKYIIRDWQIWDAPSIAKYANNRKIWMNLRDAFPHPCGIQDAESFILRATQTDSIIAFAIASPNEAIGSIGLLPGQDIHRYTAEMGFWLAEPFWGKGIMTQAVKSLTDYAVNDLKMHRVFAEPYTTNPASSKVLEKAGFYCEGVLRSNVFKDGKILDQYLYSYIKTEGTQPTGL